MRYPRHDAGADAPTTTTRAKHGARVTFGLIAGLLLAGCEEPVATPVHDHQHEHAPAFSQAAMKAAARSDLLKDVRRVTARFHSIDLAIAAGYQPTDHCVASPAGGMGFHYANQVDDQFDPLNPEVLLYEPQPNGRPKLVAVEYVVLDVGQERPSFDGYPFDIRGTPIPAPHWSLHVWLYKDNPNGIFTPFNPDVSCL